MSIWVKWLATERKNVWINKKMWSKKVDFINEMHIWRIVQAKVVYMRKIPCHRNKVKNHPGDRSEFMVNIIDFQCADIDSEQGKEILR